MRDNRAKDSSWNAIIIKKVEAVCDKIGQHDSCAGVSSAVSGVGRMGGGSSIIDLVS